MRRDAALGSCWLERLGATAVSSVFDAGDFLDGEVSLVADLIDPWGQRKVCVFRVGDDNAPSRVDDGTHQCIRLKWRVNDDVALYDMSGTAAGTRSELRLRQDSADLRHAFESSQVDVALADTA